MALCLVQLVLTACFLEYIHVNQGSLRGDYRTTYSTSPLAALYVGERPPP